MHPVEQIVKAVGGTITEAAQLPDGSGFAVMSMPLPKDHWLYAEGHNNPPMPFRIGTDDPRRTDLRKLVITAARYAIRAATMNGKEQDFDPDAMVQNFVIGMLGYNTPDALSSDPLFDPADPPAPFFK